MTFKNSTRSAILVFSAVLWLVTPATGLAQPSELIEAVKIGDHTLVNTLIARGIDVNSMEGDGATALHWATFRNNQKITRALLSAGADMNIANALGATPLWLASMNGSGALVEILLGAGAEPNAALKMGETPLMAASRAGSLHSSQALLAYGANPNSAEREREQTALMWAIAQKHVDVASLLINNGANVRARSKIWFQLENTAGNTNPVGNFKMAHGGSTALLFAARNGDIDAARILLEAGANVNVPSASGTSPLVAAAHSGHGPLAIFFLEHGADPNASDAGYTALHAATLRSEVRLVDALLEHGANVNALVTHGTPGRRFSNDYSIRYQAIGANAFWLAAKYGEPEIAQVLADHGANPFVKASNGMSSLLASMGYATGNENRRNRGYGSQQLDIAEEERSTLELAQLILDLGVDVNESDQRDNAPIHYAVLAGFKSVVELLASNGANLAATNGRGMTPLTLAETEQGVPGTNGLRSTRPLIAEQLRQLGASN